MGYVQNHGVVKIRRYGKIMGYVQNHGVCSETWGSQNHGVCSESWGSHDHGAGFLSTFEPK